MKKTKEELSRIRSEAARKGIEKRKLKGYANVGRKPGSTNSGHSAKVPPKTMTVREEDYKIFVKLAYASNNTIVEFMHIVAESLKAKNPDIFKREDQAVNM